MRRNSRRRIVTPFSLSFVVLLSITAYLAWEWKWIPWKLPFDSSTPVAEEDVASDEPDLAANEPRNDGDDEFHEFVESDRDFMSANENDIFTAQQEPEEFDDGSPAAERRNRRGAIISADFKEEAPSRGYSRNRPSAFDDDPFADESSQPQRGTVRLSAFEEDAEQNDPASSDFDRPEPIRTAKNSKGRSAPLQSINERLAEIDQLIDGGEFLTAHEALSEWYFADPDLRPDLQERIDQTAKVIFFSPQPHIEEPYIVEPGDQLRKVAKKYHVPWEFITRVNRVDPRKIRAGQKLKVITGPFSADVDVSDYRLTLTWKGLYVKSYLVGVGMKGTTPFGEFVVKDKLVDPVYYGQDGEVIANDDPKNPLGERWIDIGDSYGIHGTIEPESIGKAMSKGCIRMLNEEVEEVYDFLDIGSKVVIHP